jgi:hypothetical protein
MLFWQSARWHARQGKSHLEIVRALRRANRHVGCPFHDAQLQKMAAAAVRWAQRVSLGPEAHLPRDPAVVSAVRDTVSSVQAKVSQFSWPGVFGANCRAVLLAVLAMMGTTGKGAVDVDCRTIAERVGLSAWTASRCLRALCGIRVTQRATIPAVLLRQRREDRLAAYAYRLRSNVVGVRRKGENLVAGAATIPSSLCSPSPDSMPGIYVCVRMAVFSASGGDVFRGKRGLSKSCAVVAAALEETQVRTVKELATLCGLKQRTAERSLAALPDLASELKEAVLAMLAQDDAGSTSKRRKKQPVQIITLDDARNWREVVRMWSGDDAA